MVVASASSKPAGRRGYDVDTHSSASANSNSSANSNANSDANRNPNSYSAKSGFAGRVAVGHGSRS
jgi:hypothetical protein